MLTLAERHQLVIFISYVFRICLFPAKIDAKEWEFYPGFTSKLNERACNASYALFIAHTLYKILRLVSGFLFFRNAEGLHQLIIHLAVVACGAMIVYWYYVLFIKYPDVYLRIMQTSFSGNIGQGKIFFLNGILTTVLRSHGFLGAQG